MAGFENEKIDAMLFEADDFLIRLNEFRESKIINSTLIKCFEAVLGSIEDILDNQPTLIGSTSEKTYTSLNLKENLIKRKFFCDLCVENISGNYNSLHSHIKSFKHKGKKEKLLTLNSSCQPEECFNDPESQIKMLQEIYSQILPREIEEKLNQEKLTKLLSSFMQITSEKYVAHLFGSRLYCISNELSDFDIFLGVKDESVATKEQSAFAGRLAKLLKMQKMYRIKLVGPSIKIRDLELDIPFKLTFANGLLRVHQGLLIKYLFHNSLHRKICIAFMLIGKKFGFEFTSYQTVLLVLYYYQTKKILPPICDLQKNFPPLSSEGWQFNFSFESIYTNCDNKDSYTDNYKNFKLNLHDLFAFYSKFDFENYIICPYLGSKLLKTDFNTRMSSVRSYNEYFIKNPEKEKFKIKLKMGNIQDPIELNGNISLRTKLINAFQQYSLRVAKIGVIDCI